MTLGEMLARWVADYKVLSQEEWLRVFQEAPSQVKNPWDEPTPDAPTRPGYFPTPEERREDGVSMREFVRVGEQLIEKSDREQQGKTLGRAIGRLNGLGG